MQSNHRHPVAAWLSAVLLAAVVTAAAVAAEPPQGLLLRKGMIAWQTPLAQARPLVEENIRPKTVQLVVTHEKPPGFGCQPQGKGVTRCVWACCVDLGERDLVHFATLSFYDDKFYAYDLTFDTKLFSALADALAARLGPASKEAQENRTSLNPVVGGVSSYVVTLRRWDVGDVVVLLFDHGGDGHMLAGELYVTYRPLALQAAPPKPQDQSPPVRLPF
ncbi:MAG TPA: hypothetical protein VMB34_27725 [Acetobacteraceae bacterium]|nr:hypothetical protein [Acetobacteraceae bacterium]